MIEISFLPALTVISCDSLLYAPLPGRVTVITTSPTPTMVTFPSSSTIAISGLLLTKIGVSSVSQLKAFVSPADAEALTCAAPTGKVQFYINGKAYGDPVSIEACEDTEESNASGHKQSVAKITWTPTQNGGKYAVEGTFPSSSTIAISGLLLTKIGVSSVSPPSSSSVKLSP